MSLQLVCDHCKVQAEYLYVLSHATLHDGRRYDDAYSEPETHLHWECIGPWWTEAEEAEARKNSDEEPPF